ncbi:MAG: hypothetical protein N2C14_29660, partial [Planctomycetales bacterium]
MNRRMLGLCVPVAFLLLSLPVVAADQEKPQSAAEFLPKTTLLYAELSRPADLLKLAIDSPLSKRIQQLPDVKKGLQGKEFQDVLQVISVFENQVGGKWRPTLETMTGGGMHIAFDPARLGVVVLIKSRDEETLIKTYDALHELARADAEGKGEPDPIKSGTYRDVTAYWFNDVRYALLGPWLIITNRPPLGEYVIDRWLDGGGETLAKEADFQAARKTSHPDDSGWAYAKIGSLRDSGLAPQLFREKTNNPLGEFLAAGVLDSLRQTNHVTASLKIDGDRVSALLVAGHDSAKTHPLRKFYFAADPSKSTLNPLTPDETLLTLSSHRDAAAFWHSAEDMFDETVAAGFAQTEAGLGTFLSPRDFGGEVLPEVLPRFQFLLTRQNFKESKQPVPEIKLPAGALVLEVKDGAKLGKLLKIAFGNLIGIINIESGKNKQPQMDFDTERRGKSLFATARYSPDPFEDDLPKGLINYNFSPTLAVVGNRVILSSTMPLAESLAKLAARPEATKTRPENTSLTISGAVLRSTLADNREQLIAQNMLENGHAREK